MEDVRGRMFPERPSRFKSAFTLPSEEGARLYQSRNALNIVYEVEIIDQAKPRHFGDWRLAAMEGLSSEISLQWVEDYWGGKLLPAMPIGDGQVAESVEVLVGVAAPRGPEAQIGL